MTDDMGKRDERTYDIIGAAMEVHREMGSGFLEVIYSDSLEIELGWRGVPHVRECEIPVRYKGTVLPHTYKADFVCFDSVIVELKALDVLSGREESQIINYLKASGLKTGLLLNFGSESLQFRRFVV